MAARLYQIEAVVLLVPILEADAVLVGRGRVVLDCPIEPPSAGPLHADMRPDNFLAILLGSREGRRELRGSTSPSARAPSGRFARFGRLHAGAGTCACRLHHLSSLPLLCLLLWQLLLNPLLQ